jgi:hypothetical protein
MLLLHPTHVPAKRRPQLASGAVVSERNTTTEKLVPTFEDRGCCVVSATHPHGRILGLPGLRATEPAYQMKRLLGEFPDGATLIILREVDRQELVLSNHLILGRSMADDS